MKQRNISFFLRSVVLSLLMLHMATVVWAAETNIKMTESSDGFVKPEAENVLFYRYSAVFTAEDDTKLLFKEDSLILTDRAETRYTQGWLTFSYSMSGISVIQRAPIETQTLLIESEDWQGETVSWHLSKVAGPDGALEFTIPKGGQVGLKFLWQVPQGFKPGRVKIGAFPEVILPVKGRITTYLLHTFTLGANTTFYLLHAFGAIGGIAFLAGYFLRLFTGEYAADRIVYKWRVLMLGGTGLSSVCAALAMHIKPRMISIPPEILEFFMTIHMICIVVAIFIVFIGFVWTMWKHLTEGVSDGGFSTITVSEWTRYTMLFTLGLGLVASAASVILLLTS